MFKWLWKTTRLLDFRSTSLIVLIRKPKKNKAHACFYSKNGIRVEFYGLSDISGLIETLTGIPEKISGSSPKTHGVLQGIWSGVKFNRVEYTNPRGDRVEVTFIINIEKFPVLLEKTKKLTKNSRVKLKCAGYEFIF